ncbi:MAG: DUF4173 domain-containing protein [Anaerolineae bacterium]|nr:DUF4173 domain-containing protein [Anaerolineae bacterium]
MERRTFAVCAVLAGLAMGLLGNALFYGRPLGLSFPLYIAVGISLVLALARPAGLNIMRRNLWPLIPALFFAGMVAVRADWMVTTLNIGAVLALGGLALYYLPLKRPLDEASIQEHTLNLIETGIVVVPQSFIEVGQSWEWLREKRHQRGGAFVSAARGLMFAVPVVAVFAFLLGSADAVFASYVNQAWEGVRRALGLELMGDTLGHLGVILALASVVTGAIGWGIQRRVTPSPPAPSPSGRGEEDEDGADEATAQDEKRKPAFKLGIIESGIVMGSVVALFAAFVAIQFAYFFGGQSVIEVQGLTYAQYARRGFFELVAVSVLTLGMALWLDRVTMRQGKNENRAFLGLALAIAGLTGVMLVSAFQRMWLYEEEYGFTQLRVYTHVFMIWLGVMFGVYGLALFRVRKNIFSLGMLLSIIGYLMTLNLMNVDAYIAERNIARYRAGHDLDIAFLDILSPDATAPILALYQESAGDPIVSDWAGQWLARSWTRLGVEQAERSLFSANMGKDSAWAQLESAAGTLPAYDPSRYWGSYWSSYGENYSDYGSGWDTVVTPGR